MAEIEAGYPMLVWLQDYDEYYRSLPQMPQANPSLHAMLIHGYRVDDAGVERVYVRNSWGDSRFNPYRVWAPVTWAPTLGGFYPVRGVIGYRPKPQLTSIGWRDGQLVLRWIGPSAQLYDAGTGGTRDLHWYVVEACDDLAERTFRPVTEPSTEMTATVTADPSGVRFYRVSLVPAPSP
jgi:hypothetical protein